MPLTDTAIRNAKPTEKSRKLTDEKGLYLILNPNGSKYWRFDYSFAGKRKTLSMGVYPETTLKDARERRDAARKLLADGVEPGENRKAQKAARIGRTENSFEVVAREWFEKNRACKNFCVNGHPAGNCHIARSDDDRRKESSPQGVVGQPVG